MKIAHQLPILFSLLAFICFINPSETFTLVTEREYPWHNKFSIKERLSKLGRDKEADYENFRIAQMTLMIFVATFVAFLVVLGLLSMSAALILVALGLVAVVVISERRLTSHCAKRRAEIEAEFPAVVEIMSLAVSAGESPAAAFRRIGQRAQGHLPSEIRAVVRDIEDGKSFISAVDAMGRRLDSEPIRRFSDSLVISISRGSSLLETLEHAVGESRNQNRTTLISAASKSEISMLIPVVFLILPISILFALYPSLSNLNLFTS